MKFIANDDDIRGDFEEVATLCIKFLNCWYISVPTTCCYQVSVDCNLDNLDVEVIQFFCLSGFVINYPVLDYWLHCFMAASFYYFTSMAIYRVGGKIYICNFPGIYVFAWGKEGRQQILMHEELQQGDRVEGLEGLKGKVMLVEVEM